MCDKNKIAHLSDYAYEDNAHMERAKYICNIALVDAILNNKSHKEAIRDAGFIYNKKKHIYE